MIATLDQVRELKEAYMKAGTNLVSMSSIVPTRTWNSHELALTTEREVQHWGAHRQRGNETHRVTGSPSRVTWMRSMFWVLIVCWLGPKDVGTKRMKRECYVGGSLQWPGKSAG